MSKFVAFLFTLLCGVVAVCVSSSQAFIYFLPDYEDNVIVSSSCHRQGYEYNRDNCPLPRVLENKCPSDEWYRTCACYGSESCTGDTAEVNPFPVETGSVRTSCKDCGGNLLYSWQCSPSGECDGYNLTDCPEHGYCSQCCDGFYKLESCASAYEIVGDVCELKETCFGEETRKSGADYSCTDCETKEGKRLYTCECIGNCNLSSCPLYGTCSSDCKGNYCLTGCQEGYKLNSSATGCIDECDKVLEGCDTGYEFVNQCVRKSDGKTYGDCVNCKDETAFSNPCKGYYTCSGGGRVPDGDPLCYCGNVPYYKRCLVQETCLVSYMQIYKTELGSCTIRSDMPAGWITFGEHCRTLNNNVYWLASSCIDKNPNCFGDIGPCAGKKECYGDVGEGLCECAGKKFFDTCTETCNRLISPYFNDKGHVIDYEGDVGLGFYHVKDKCTRVTDGSVVKIKEACNWEREDANGNIPPCAGMEICDEDAEAECECGGRKYCTKDPCSKAHYLGPYPNGWCYAVVNGKFASNQYFIRDVCTRKNGDLISYAGNCDFETNCDGTSSPVLGLNLCKSGTFGRGDVRKCGSNIYATECIAECNYEETEETCSTAGKSFNRKCMDNSGTWFGECV